MKELTRNTIRHFSKDIGRKFLESFVIGFGIAFLYILPMMMFSEWIKGEVIPNGSLFAWTLIIIGFTEAYLTTVIVLCLFVAVIILGVCWTFTDQWKYSKARAKHEIETGEYYISSTKQQM